MTRRQVCSALRCRQSAGADSLPRPLLALVCHPFLRAAFRQRHVSPPRQLQPAAACCGCSLRLHLHLKELSTANRQPKRPPPLRRRPHIQTRINATARKTALTITATAGKDHVVPHYWQPPTSHHHRPSQRAGTARHRARARQGIYWRSTAVGPEPPIHHRHAACSATGGAHQERRAASWVACMRRWRRPTTRRRTEARCCAAAAKLLKMISRRRQRRQAAWRERQGRGGQQRSGRGGRVSTQHTAELPTVHDGKLAQHAIDIDTRANRPRAWRRRCR